MGKKTNMMSTQLAATGGKSGLISDYISTSGSISEVKKYNIQDGNVVLVNQVQVFSDFSNDHLGSDEQITESDEKNFYRKVYEHARSARN